MSQPVTQPVNQPSLIELWEEHTKYEFAVRDTDATIATMVDDAYVNHIPVMTGGYGKAALHRFYSQDFISKMPPDTELKPISRTVGTDQLVDEMIFSFTHTMEMPWMLPGIPPPTNALKYRWWPSSISAMASWPMSTSTGTRHPSLSKSACSAMSRCPSTVPKQRAAWKRGSLPSKGA